MTTFSDIFKKSFLEGYASIELSAKQIIVVIFFAVLLIACNYVVDLLYGIIDPRIKL